MRNQKTYIALAIVVLITSAALVAFALQPSAKDLMRQAIETMQATTDSHAIATFTMTTPEKSATGTMEIWGKFSKDEETPPSFRVEVLDASEAEFVGITAVSDGSNFWMYNPAENKVLVSTAEEAADMMAAYLADKDFAEFNPEKTIHSETPEETVDKLLEYFTAERIADQQIGTTNAHGLRLIPIPEQMPSELGAAGGFLRVYIRPEDGAPLAVEYAEGMIGSGSATATLLEINQGIEANLFTFTIPEGAEVLTLEEIKPQELTPEEAANLHLLSPTSLPNDASYVNTMLVRGALVQRYHRANGRSFTVSQGPASAVSARDDIGIPVTVRGLAGTLFTSETGDQALLTWSDGDTIYWVGGQLTSDEAIAIAESLE
ncbi:MAG: hypothetical protein CSA11_02230 [Chloroflexi bacterium]|nr:MAG: hypothetical protein CSB13_04195 [Chloroflexota bacterium]PIE81954.1 MAG: hypothetical protein CSA11_02230 [Chloroflexota bacterium]